MRWRSFGEWKAYAVAHIIALKQKYSDDAKIVKDLDFLLSKLHYLRGRDLSNFLLYVHIVIRDDGVKELYDVIPTADEILALIRG